MSEPIEKISGRSIMVSALGTWTGLGFGLGVLVTAMMGVTGVLAELTPPSRAVNALEQKLGADLSSLAPGSLKLNGDGTQLTLTVLSQDMKKVSVSYRKSENNVLQRQEQGLKPVPLGRCRELKFRKQDALLLASVTDEHGRTIETWSTSRWGKGR